MIKNLAKIFLTVFIVFAIVFVFNSVYKNKDQFFSIRTLEIIRNKINGAVNRNGCAKPIAYSLGRVDKNFGLSTDQFLKAVKEAEGIWEKSSGKDLVNYSDTGELKINLVFDERQEDTMRMQEILGSISSDEEKLAAVKIEYNKITAEVKFREQGFKEHWTEYERSQAQFEELASVYNTKIAEYEKQVDFWNTKGGAPKKEYDDLVQQKAEIDGLFIQLSSEREALQKTLLALDEERKEFNSLVTQVNTIAGIFNRLADKLNVRVVSFNEVQGSRDEFVSGLYTFDSSGEKIDIFQFYDNKDLVITIAHELGHALGLGHASGTSSIMYPKSEGQKITLSKEDLQMLSAVCNQI